MSVQSLGAVGKNTSLVDRFAAVMNSSSRSTFLHHRNSLQIALTICAITLLLYTGFAFHTIPSWLEVTTSFRTSSPIQHSFAEGLDVPINTTQWGEMGKRVRQLSQWARLVFDHPSSEERQLLSDALVSQFSFLADTNETIYTPWGPPTAEFTSRVGYVICTGSNNFHLAAHLITSLRRVHQSSSPIEIAYAGDGDLRPEHRAFLQDLAPGISFIDLLDRFPSAHDDLINGGWAMKPFALLASSHKLAILVDADALFLTSPDWLFESNSGLSRTGTLFFHDRAAVGGTDDRRFWVKDQIKAAGLGPSRYLATESLFYAGATWYEMDSGVVAVDKTRIPVLLGLMFATWMNTKAVREAVTYKIFYGDKETFWLAMELSGVEYFFQPWYAGTMGTITEAKSQDKGKVEICGTHMLHLDQLGQVPFWINGGVYEHKDDPKRAYAQMTHYWVGETSDIRYSQPDWYWINGNTACLKEGGVRKIPGRIRRSMQSIQAQARRVDEMIRERNL
ncbi:hypothetical protein LTR41_003770 [Exophiala xenobiotica]|nr:hypothetical protein LTR41_003770 [Exophiala xenobiotica]